MIYTEENLPKEIQKYLKKFGMKGWELERSSSEKYKAAVVIPALSEYENIRNLLKSFLKCDHTYSDKYIIIFVLNNLESAEDKVKEDNLRSVKMLREIISGSLNNDKLISEIVKSKLTFGLVDASTAGKGLPDKDGGVGLARKIGMDLSLSGFDYNQKGKNIILCTDADSTVEKNYFTEVYNQVKQKNIKAGYVKFNHPVEGDIESQHAIVCYEIFLRYYVLGLQYANSPYAIHTIGSTMLSDAETYVKIQGMNKRKAAEDFYFMEKLCKNVRVDYIKSTSIYPSGRGSWRVPFGTGQRVNRFLSNEVDEYQLYSVENFEVLKDWLKIFNDETINSASYYIEKAAEITPALKEFLIQQNFENDWNKILKHTGNDNQINRQKVFWFDGFRTLKLIHFLRDEENPNEQMFDALDNILSKVGSEFPARSDSIPNLETQIKYLNILREIA